MPAFDRRSQTIAVSPMPAAAPDRQVAVVIAGTRPRDIVGSLLAALQGTVAVRELDDLGRPDAVVLVADCAAPAGMAALRRVHKAAPGARLLVVARDDSR